MSLRIANAFFLREASAACANHMFYALPALFLALGFLPLFGEDIAASAPLLLLQVLLYIVPLVCVVAGVSAAQADQSENPFLANLPTGPLARTLGKFALLLTFFALAELALVLPAFLAGAPLIPLIRLWGFAAGASGTFLAIGICAGFHQNDGVRAHLNALALWFVFTFGFGFAAWILAGTRLAHANPALWTALIGLSPLDTLRVSVLFNVEAVPFATQDLDPATRLWLSHSDATFALVCIFWASLALTLARPQMK